ncbi:helix-turn-helix domain-containing protein [Psychrobacter sp. T6-1]|uniref:helix-turn-helix domain-containing protein n=1 Tax=Psychrobacter sp. T6-1 TaxID=3457447 RepID=UPI003FD26790
MTTPSSHQSSGAQGSFGAMLQQARASKQISLDEAASELFILKRHLQALENENFSDLPQVAFARGFAINYAKFLDLDPIKVADSFDAAYPNELKQHSINNIDSPLRPMGTLQRDTHNRIRFNPMLVIAVIALIILAIFLYRMVSNATSDNAQEPTPLSEDISAAEQTQGAAIDNQDTVGASGSALNLGEPTTNARLPLVVSITDPVVVNITDAAGSSLMTGDQTAGTYELLGAPPLNVNISDTAGVSMTFNQEPVAMDEYAAGDQASFILNP